MVCVSHKFYSKLLLIKRLQSSKCLRNQTEKLQGYKNKKLKDKRVQWLCGFDLVNKIMLTQLEWSLL